MTIPFTLSGPLRSTRRRLRDLAASPIALKSAHLACMLLGLYAIVFTYVSLNGSTHESRLRDVQRLLVIGLLDAAGVKAMVIYEPVYQSALASGQGRHIFRRIAALLELKKAEMQLTVLAHDDAGSQQAVNIVRNGCGATLLKSDELLREVRAAEARKTIFFEFWKTPNQINLQNPDREFSPSAILMSVEGR